VPDADLLAEWIRRTRASMVLLAAGGVMGALFVLGFGLLPIRTFVLVGPVVLLLFVGGVLVAVGRWVRRIPFTRRPIGHPPLRRVDRAAQVVGSGSVLLLVLGVVLLGGGAVGDRNAVSASPRTGCRWRSRWPRRLSARRGGACGAYRRWSDRLTCSPGVLRPG
jgi:hypothetical protein